MTKKQTTKKKVTKKSLGYLQLGKTSFNLDALSEMSEKDAISLHPHVHEARVATCLR